MSMEWILSKLASKQQAIEDNVCNLCGEQVLSFKDPLSEAEYQISALCQNCQDDMFDEDPFVEDRGISAEAIEEVRQVRKDNQNE